MFKNSKEDLFNKMKQGINQYKKDGVSKVIASYGNRLSVISIEDLTYIDIDNNRVKDLVETKVLETLRYEKIFKGKDRRLLETYGEQIIKEELYQNLKLIFEEQMKDNFGNDIDIEDYIKKSMKVEKENNILIVELDKNLILSKERFKELLKQEEKNRKKDNLMDNVRSKEI